MTCAITSQNILRERGKFRLYQYKLICIFFKGRIYRSTHEYYGEPFTKQIGYLVKKRLLYQNILNSRFYYD